MPEHTIAENLARLQAAKTAIGNAIVAKGGTVNSGDGLEEYPADIASIETAELTSISITANGVYTPSDTEEVESSNLPIVIEADGTTLIDYLISGNMAQSGTPTPTNPIQPQECGERTGNLFDMSFYEGKSGITVSGNKATGECNRFYNVKLSIPPELYGQELTWSVYLKRPDNPNTVRLQTADNGSYKYGNNIAGEGRSTVSFTATSTIRLYINYANTGSDTIELSDITLNLSSTPLPYEPYGYKIPITSAGQTNNIYLGEVPTTRKIKKYEFTGNETFYASSQTSVYYTTQISAVCNKSVIYSTGCIINAYKIRKQSTEANLLDGEFTTDTNGYLWFRNYNYATLADFKEYLAAQYAAGTPVTVWYVLANEETGIVNEPLCKIGDYADTVSMEQAKVQIPTNTSPSTTTVGILTTLPPSLLYVKYNTSTTSGYNYVDVNVPNTYSSSDEGKVVSNRQLIPQIAKPDTITANNTYDTTNYNSVTVDVKNSYTASDEGKVVNNGALVSQTAKPDTITTNSTYNTMLYSSVTVNVENSYSASDEGKVVSNGALVSQTTMPTAITTNDTYNTTTYNSVTVNVPNTYTQSDEGKVVSNGALVAQTAKPTEITVNDTYDTTTYNSVTVDVPNTYTQSDEGKVVSNGGLVAQTTKPDVIVENGVYDTTLYNSVNVNVSSDSQERKDVNFYDYDGTIVKSYTATEFANISELPDNPSHDGLTSQGWNWSLADAKSYVAKYGKLEIGQMYVTSDGKTRIYITLTEGRISPVLQLYLNINSELDIDWGDNSTHSTFTSTTAGYKNERHDYATAGNYVIAITVITGSFVLQSSSSNVSSILWNENNITNSPDKAYNNSIRKVEIGTGITRLGYQAFQGCNSLTSVTIPNTVTDSDPAVFINCYSLTSVAIPNTVTIIRDYAFGNCTSLSSITIPDSVTTIGSQAFTVCYSLTSATIPDSVTNIGSQIFNYCQSLSYVTIGKAISLGYNAFRNCTSLSSITIPDSVTTISDTAFGNCYSLSSITIPDSVTTIGREAFVNCSYMESIKFTSTTPPTVSSSNAWSGLRTTCIIYVPAGTLYIYKTATNYPNPSTYTYVEY